MKQRLNTSLVSFALRKQNVCQHSIRGELLLAVSVCLFVCLSNTWIVTK